jgi:hypothetical protein
MTREQERPDAAADEVVDAARSVEDQIQRLCRAALPRPNLTPAEVDVVLTHLAAAAGALPQTVSQLGDILDRARHHYALEMDTLTPARDPHLALDTARGHLAAVRELAFDLYRLLDAAHNQTAHISTRSAPADSMNYGSAPSPARRPEDRRPPTSGGFGPVVPR